MSNELILNNNLIPTDLNTKIYLVLERDQKLFRYNSSYSGIKAVIFGSTRIETPIFLKLLNSILNRRNDGLGLKLEFSDVV